MRRTIWSCIVVLAVLGCATVPEANIMLSPQHNWLAIGYDQDRSESILKTNQAAQHQCRQQGQKHVLLLSEVTVYQGRFDQSIAEAAKTAGQVVSVYGSVEGGQIGQALSSSTDYRTTIEFLCE